MEEKEIISSDFVREVTARYIGPRRKSIKIMFPADAAKFVSSLLRDQAREHFIALYLDGAGKIVSHSLVSLGGANSAPAGIRETFQGAVIVGACGLICGHNHPSSDLTPSNEDRAVTNKLAEAGKLLGIPLLDHIIVADGGYFSFKEKDLL